MQLTRELQDKSLRIEFSDGEIADIKAASTKIADSRDTKSFEVIGEPT